MPTIRKQCEECREIVSVGECVRESCPFLEKVRYELGYGKKIRAEKFKKELEQLINKYSVENYSDTPDFILAQYIAGCLDVFNKAVKRRDKWYGHKGLSGKTGDKVPTAEKVEVPRVRYVKCPRCNKLHKDTGNVGVCEFCNYALIPTYGKDYKGTKYDARKNK